MRRRTASRGSPLQRYVAPAHLALGVPAEPVGDRRGLLGSSETRAVQPTAGDPQPAADVDQVGVRRRLGEALPGSVTSGRSASTRTTRRAATNARIHLLANSVAVRSGIIRKAA